MIKPTIPQEFKEFLEIRDNDSYLIHKTLLFRNLIVPERYNFCSTKAEYVYCILYNIHSTPLCHCSNTPLRFKNINSGYASGCSSSCASSNLITQEKCFNSWKNIF